MNYFYRNTASLGRNIRLQVQLPRNKKRTRYFFFNFIKKKLVIDKPLLCPTKKPQQKDTLKYNSKILAVKIMKRGIIAVVARRLEIADGLRNSERLELHVATPLLQQVVDAYRQRYQDDEGFYRYQYRFRYFCRGRKRC